jgi:hypothetical protein
VLRPLIVHAPAPRETSRKGVEHRVRGGTRRPWTQAAGTVSSPKAYRTSAARGRARRAEVQQVLRHWLPAAAVACS